MYGGTERRRIRLIQMAALPLTDLLAFLLPYLIIRLSHIKAPVVFYHQDPAGGGLVSQAAGLDWYVLLSVSTIVVLMVTGCYASRRSVWDEMRQLARAVSMAAVADVLVLYTAGYGGSFGLLLLSWVMVALALPLLRFFVKSALTRMGLWRLPTVIIGSGANAEQAVGAQQAIVHGLRRRGIIRLVETDGAGAGGADGFPVSNMRPETWITSSQPLLHVGSPG